MKTIHVGFEVGTGKPLAIPLRHLAVTGQTQESGKTTTLEALASRAGVAALAFVTKRGEGSFRAGHRVAPYFRDRADWQFVVSIIDATLQEKNKFLRPWIMRICRTTKTLAEVQAAVREALKTAKGINEGVYTQLDAYLDLIVPEIRSAKLAPALTLQPGLNVMDVSASSTPMQMLFVQSALDWVNAHARDTVVVVPEAWEFIPEGKGSPAKASAVSLVRKGGGIGNHIWVDSQDMAGVDKTILRGCAVWLIGVQREANEIKRNLSNIPAGIQRPKAEEVATLGRGQFYACWGERTVKVYVQPAWLSEADARREAMGGHVPAQAPVVVERTKEEPKMCEQHQKLERELEAAKRRIAEVEAQAGQDRLDVHAGQLFRQILSALAPGIQRTDAAGGTTAAVVDEDAIVRRVLAQLPAGGGGRIQVTAPEALRLQVQQDVARRLVDAARQLPPVAKRLLKVHVALDKRISQRAAAERAGAAWGGSVMEAYKALSEESLIESHPKNGTRAAVRERIVHDLGDLGAQEPEVEAVYQSVLYELATESAAA